jgi:hypothetical protein
MSFINASNGLPGAPSSQHSVWLGDINNDNNLDIATAGYLGVRVWTGDGAGNWFLASNGLPASSYDGGICLGDIDNNDDLDLAATNYDLPSAGVGVWTGNGAGSWTPAMVGLPTSGWRTGIILGDINNDYNLDLAFANEDSGSNPGGVTVLTGNGAGVWSDASTNLPTDGKYFAVWMGDVNHDNYTDLAVAGAGLHVWLGNGAGVWTEASNGLPWTDQWNGITLGDINLDGNLDLVASMDQTGHGIRAWLGDGTSNWTPASTGLPTLGLYYGVILADLVGDKYPDILAAGFGGEGIRIWKGNGGINWTDASSSLPTGKVIGVSAGDVNNDGYNDIGSVGENYGVQVWVNNATVPPLTVTVEEPNGGENWQVGTQHYINWTATGGTPPLTMKIEYSTDGVLGPYTLVSDSEPNDGSYLWTVPGTPSANAFVRVNATDSSVQNLTNWDKSNESFAIRVGGDSTPPTISNLQPVNQSTISDNMTAIGATYSDSSGINAGSVVLKVDGVDMTSSSAVTDNDVTYSPSAPLSEGLHDVYLEVSDLSMNQSKASDTWWFVVDTLGPTISNPLPANQSIISDSTPTISASYADTSGIDTSTVVLKVDSVDVTPSASVTPNGVSYTPIAPMPDAVHNIYLEVGDNSTPPNVAVETWWFAVETAPPLITINLPVNESTISDPTPFISASFSDPSGINTTSVLMKVDTVDVTSFAIVSPTDITYTSGPLLDGVHDVFLSVNDSTIPGNQAISQWWFVIDTTILDPNPPTISNLEPLNETIMTETMPTIGASFTDLSGINVSSVVLKLDSVDVTGGAIITPVNLTYDPALPLSEGIHNVYLEVSDDSSSQNMATATWWFVVDSLPPIITDMTPVNESIISDSTPIISANLTDGIGSGIDTSSIVLRVDGIDFTSSAIKSATHVTFTPSLFAEGLHSASLEVKDNSNPQNSAVVSWWFDVDSIKPSIFNLAPQNGSLVGVNVPTISAEYSDYSGSGIDTTNIVLKMDSIEVTSSAIVTASGLNYVPQGILVDGVHNVHLEVEDNSAPGNVASASWWFRIDTSPPSIDHDPVAMGNVGTDVELIAIITDDSGIESVTIYYRGSEGGPFSQIPMLETSTPGRFKATIPGEAVTTAGIQYYLEAKDSLNNTARSPEADWTSSPHVIDVSETSEFPWMLLAIVVLGIILLAILLIMYLSKRGKGTEGIRKARTRAPKRVTKPSTAIDEKAASEEYFEDREAPEKPKKKKYKVKKRSTTEVEAATEPESASLPAESPEKPRTRKYKVRKKR